MKNQHLKQDYSWEQEHLKQDYSWEPCINLPLAGESPSDLRRGNPGWDFLCLLPSEADSASGSPGCRIANTSFLPRIYKYRS